MDLRNPPNGFTREYYLRQIFQRILNDPNIQIEIERIDPVRNTEENARNVDLEVNDNVQNIEENARNVDLVINDNVQNIEENVRNVDLEGNDSIQNIEENAGNYAPRCKESEKHYNKDANKDNLGEFSKATTRLDKEREDQVDSNKNNEHDKLKKLKEKTLDHDNYYPDIKIFGLDEDDKQEFNINNLFKKNKQDEQTSKLFEQDVKHVVKNRNMNKCEHKKEDTSSWQEQGKNKKDHEDNYNKLVDNKLFVDTYSQEDEYEDTEEYEDIDEDEDTGEYEDTDEENSCKGEEDDKAGKNSGKSKQDSSSEDDQKKLISNKLERRDHKEGKVNRFEEDSSKNEINDILEKEPGKSEQDDNSEDDLEQLFKKLNIDKNYEKNYNIQPNGGDYHKGDNIIISIEESGENKKNYSSEEDSGISEPDGSLKDDLERPVEKKLYFDKYDQEMVTYHPDEEDYYIEGENSNFNEEKVEIFAENNQVNDKYYFEETDIN